MDGQARCRPPAFYTNGVRTDRHAHQPSRSNVKWRECASISPPLAATDTTNILRSTGEISSMSVEHEAVGSEASERGAHAGGPAGLARLASTEIAAIVAAESARCQDDWRRIHDTAQAAIVSLQRLCDVPDPRHAAQSSPEIGRVVERLVAAAAVEIGAVAGRARREAETRLADAQTALAKCEAELQADRAELQAVRERLENEIAACARAERSWEEAEREHDRTVTSYQSRLQSTSLELETARAELQGVRSELQAARADLEAFRTERAAARQQLEAAQAERVKLHAALEAIQSAVGLVESDGSAPAAPGDGVVQGAPATPAGSTHVTAVPASRAAAPVSRSLKLVSQAPAPSPDWNPELVEYANSLLDQIEAAYWSDLESARSAVEAVDRLTENLRTARDLYARRSDSTGSAESPLFRQRLIALLNTRSETSFGRHLAIAAYQLYPIRPQAQAGVARAS
jgi:hypothetical protein